MRSFEATRLVTERLVLRLPRLEDADGLLDAIADPEVMRWIGGKPGGRDDAVAAIERWIAAWERDGIGHFVVERAEDGTVIGRVGFLVWDTGEWVPSSYAEAGEAAVTEIGWTLARVHWGRGYATEAGQAARSWGWRERALNGLISLILPENQRSIRVAEKLGATCDRTIETRHGPTTVWVHR